MIKVLSGQQMKKVDQKAIKELGIPDILLMENAGRAVYEKAAEIACEDEMSETKSALVICGKGNNGGDGFVAARHLIENSIQTTVISLFKPDKLSGAALVNHNILENFTKIIYFDDIEITKFREIISFSDIIIDAIFGTGLNSEVRGFLGNVIDSINEYAENDVISVDIPSGINADTGEVLGCAVVADFTVTFHAPKTGLLLYPGAEHCGEIVITPIGIPEIFCNLSYKTDYEQTQFPALQDEKEIYLITEHYAHISFPIRAEDSNKSTFGKVFNVSGSFTMPGAAYMCSMSSLLTGAGYSTLAAPKSIIPIVASKSSEIVYVALAETSEGTISENAQSEALDKSKESTVILIGPGLSMNESTVKFTTQFIQQIINRGDTVIIDGDGLNSLATQKNIVLPINSIITPHPKELSRLMKIPVEEILKDRIGSARKASQKFNTTVILKGANTIIAEPFGNIYINITGNSGLAAAGSGDVLAGMIAGFIAQGVNIKDAAILGVYLHGLAADIAIQEINEYSLTAGKLMEYLPKALNKLQ